MDDRPTRLPETAWALQFPPRRQPKPAYRCAIYPEGNAGSAEAAALVAGDRRYLRDLHNDDDGQSS